MTDEEFRYQVACRIARIEQDLSYIRTLLPSHIETPIVVTLPAKSAVKQRRLVPRRRDYVYQTMLTCLRASPETWTVEDVLRAFRIERIHVSTQTVRCYLARGAQEGHLIRVKPGSYQRGTTPGLALVEGVG